MLASDVVSASIVRGRADGETVANHLGGTITFRATADETAEALTVIEIVVAPGEGPWLHRHPDSDEFLYTIEGSMRVRLDDDVVEAPAGTFVFLPRGLPHTWQNAGDAPARLLAAFVPGGPGMESFFRESARFAGEASAGEVFQGVGSGGEMELVGPPLSESHP